MKYDVTFMALSSSHGIYNILFTVLYKHKYYPPQITQITHTQVSKYLVK